MSSSSSYSFSFRCVQSNLKRIRRGVGVLYLLSPKKISEGGGIVLTDCIRFAESFLPTSSLYRDFSILLTLNPEISVERLELLSYVFWNHLNELLDPLIHRFSKNYLEMFSLKVIAL